MTVGEMIRRLSQLNKDDEIITEDGDLINKVEVTKITDIFNDETEYVIVR